MPLIYQTYLQLLVRHLVTLPSLPQYLTILRKLISSLPMDAFSTRIRRRVPTAAAELVERAFVLLTTTRKLPHPGSKERR